ncbi:hypothetical protein TNCV_1133451 [Trichonephila clavipes]|nr:hypothetical protein TNCV_1133451 [Trichonephila clavipes]
MRCHLIRHTVTPNIDPRHHDSSLDSPEVLSRHSSATFATYNKTPRSHFSTEQWSLPHSKFHTTASATFPPFLGLLYPQICHRLSIYEIIKNGKLDSLRVWSN